MSSKDYHMVTE
jgi:hypothetical protein